MNKLDEKIKKIKKEIYSLERSIDKYTIDKMSIIENMTNQEILIEKSKLKIIEIQENCQKL